MSRTRMQLPGLLSPDRIKEIEDNFDKRLAESKSFVTGTVKKAEKKAKSPAAKKTKAIRDMEAKGYSSAKIADSLNIDMIADCGYGSDRDLFPWQAEGVEYLMDQYGMDRGGLLFMEMRLGKTLTMLRFIFNNSTFSRVLITAPLSVCHSWNNELKEEGVPEAQISLIAGMTPVQRMKELALDKQFVLVPHGLMVRDHTIAYSEFFDCVIVDESVVLANPQNKISEVMVSPNFFKCCKHFYCLAGNPAPETKLQLFQQFKVAQGSYMGTTNYWNYRAKNFDNYGFEFIPKPAHNDELTRNLHQRAFVRNRKECNMGSKKIYKTIKVPMTKLQKKLYDDMALNWTLEGTDVSTETAPVKVMYLARIAGGYNLVDDFVSDEKTKAIKHLMKGDLKGEKVLVWFRFRNELDRFYESMKKDGYKICKINGDTKPEVREQYRQDFMSPSGNLQISAMIIATSKRGLDWSGAAASIYHSNEYSNEARSQSEDRLIHPKKTQDALIIDLETENSVDEDVALKLRDKKLNTKMLMFDLLNRVKKGRKKK